MNIHLNKDKTLDTPDNVFNVNETDAVSPMRLSQDTDTFNRTNNSIFERYSESIVEFDLEKDNDDLNNNTNETFENESLNDESSISNITYYQSVVNKESNQSSIQVPDFLKRK